MFACLHVCPFHCHVCSAEDDPRFATELWKLRNLNGFGHGPLPVYGGSGSSGPSLDLRMELNPAEDDFPSSGPLGMDIIIDCDTDVNSTGLFPDEPPVSANYLPADAPYTCAGGTGRQTVFYITYAVHQRDVRYNTPLANFSGCMPDQFRAAGYNVYNKGLPPAQNGDKLIDVVMFLPGLNNEFLEYAPLTDKFSDVWGQIVIQPQLLSGDRSWELLQPPNDWGQQALLSYYRVRAEERMVMIMQRLNTTCPGRFCGKIGKLRGTGHSDGAIDALHAWKGSPHYGYGPVSGVDGVIPLMDQGMWQETDAGIQEAFGNITVAALYSQSALPSQGFWRLHADNYNTDANNHFIFWGSIHNGWQFGSWRASKLSLLSGNYQKYKDIYPQSWAAPGLTKEYFNLAPPYDHMDTAASPVGKAREQDVFNAAQHVFNDFFVCLGQPTDASRHAHFHALFSVENVEHWQKTTLQPKGLIMHYGRPHNFNYSMTNTPTDDIRLKIGTEWFFDGTIGGKPASSDGSISSSDSYESSAYYIDLSQGGICGYEFSRQNRTALMPVQCPRYFLKSDPTCSPNCVCDTDNLC